MAAKARLYAKDLPDELRDDVWAWFADGLEPLKDAGQLGSILLQYPRWFFTSSENRDAIEEAVGRLREAGMTGAVEFRSATWFNEKNLERTLVFLADRNIPLVIVDGPQGFKSSVPAGRRDLAGPRDHALPRSSDRDLGGEGHPDRRALPVPVRPGRAGRLGAAGPEAAGPGRGHPRPVQQLLRELRRHQRVELAQLLLDLEASDS